MPISCYVIGLLLGVIFPECVARKVLVFEWGSGVDCACLDFTCADVRITSVRACPRRVRMAVPLGFGGGPSDGRRKGVACVALCGWDWWGGRRLYGAVPLGLVGVEHSMQPI